MYCISNTVRRNIIVQKLVGLVPLPRAILGAPPSGPVPLLLPLPQLDQQNTRMEL